MSVLVLLWPRVLQIFAVEETGSFIKQNGYHGCSLRWRHNDHEGVSNHQPHGCLLNRLFRRRSKKTSKLCVTGLCVGKSPDRWLPRTKGQLRGKCFHFMTSSWIKWRRKEPAHYQPWYQPRFPGIVGLQPYTETATSNLNVLLKLLNLLSTGQHGEYSTDAFCYCKYLEFIIWRSLGIL